jgi:hypothetical protein
MSYLNLGDWGVLQDQDVAFLSPNTAKLIRGYIERTGEAGLLVSKATRCSYEYQRGNLKYNNDSIQKAKDEILRQEENKFNVTVIREKISGHLMAIKKDVWQEIREDMKERIYTGGKWILGVDTQLGYSIRYHMKKVYLMEGVMVFHCFRTDGKREHLW